MHFNQKRIYLSLVYSTGIDVAELFICWNNYYRYTRALKKKSSLDVNTGFLVYLEFLHSGGEMQVA